MALLSNAEPEAQSIDQGRRTLKEARSKQKFVKLSRQYYGSSASSTSGRSFQHGTNVTSSGAGVKCLSCGGSHKTGHCPKKNQVHQAEVHEQAPFICMTDQVLNTADVDANLAPTHQAMTDSKAVIDGGSTRTLGSVTALENLMNINAKQRGELDPEQRPVFGFRNSSSDRCLSTVWMKILAEGREGHLKVHTLDRGEGPILFSIETLRSVGAVIDFEHDLIVFRKLSDEHIIQLEPSSSGHQWLPLVNGWYRGSRKATTRVPCLKEPDSTSAGKREASIIVQTSFCNWMDELDDKKHDERDETNDVVGDVFEGVVETESTGHQSNPKSPVLSSTVSHEKDLVHLTANAARDSLCPGDQSLASGAIPVSHMPALTKSQLVAALTALGEMPPKS